MHAIQIDPVIFHLGALQIRWYGLMYVVAFVIGGHILKKLAQSGFLKIPENKVDSLLFWCLIGMLVGARTFYVFLYNWDHYSNFPIEMIAIWKGGLSFHGALVGIITAMFLFAKKWKLHFFQIADCIAVCGSQGLFFGRIGNFINHELYGRATDVPWGMIFSGGGPYPRHPSQLYEAIFEGLVLFLILFLVSKRTKYYGVVSGLFMGGYGFFRYVIEFFREPDVQLGYYLGGTTTMGQILCLLMMLASVGIILYAYKIKIPTSKSSDLSSVLK